MPDAAGTATVHATAVLLGAAGLLIRGRSGAGKTTSALALIGHCTARRRFAALVADDRVLLQACSGRVVARAPAALAGLLEARGIGIVEMQHERAAVLRLVVDLVAERDVFRVPEGSQTSVDLLGVVLPRILAAPGASLIPLVLLALQRISQPRDVSHNACVCAAT